VNLEFQIERSHGKKEEEEDGSNIVRREVVSMIFGRSAFLQQHATMAEEQRQR
jgi:hypothetical protein